MEASACALLLPCAADAPVHSYVESGALLRLHGGQWHNAAVTTQMSPWPPSDLYQDGRGSVPH